MISRKSTLDIALNAFVAPGARADSPPLIAVDHAVDVVVSSDSTGALVPVMEYDHENLLASFLMTGEF